MAKKATKKAAPAAETPTTQNPPPAPRNIAIVGKAPSRVDAPYGQAGWEIWGLGDLFRVIPNWQPRPTDRWFELHDWETAFQRWLPEHRNWLISGAPCPIYVQHDPASRPNDTTTQLRYPVGEILRHFNCRYFTNTVAWQLALAIYEHDQARAAGHPGVAQIAVFGVDMAQNDPAKGNNGEYQHQRPSCEFWVGFAAGRGIRLTIPPNSDLLKCHRLYAYDTHKGDGWQRGMARVNELGQVAAHHLSQKKQHEQAQFRAEGARDNAHYMTNNFMLPPPANWEET